MNESQPESAKEYLEKVRFRVEVSELYKVIDSCVYDPNNVFCPVLVEIMNDEIIKENDGKKYLLQVWSNQGEMIYERQMDSPVTNWNISTDKFLFQEPLHPNVLFLVKLELKKRPTLFELHFPGKKLENLLQDNVVVET